MQSSRACGAEGFSFTPTRPATPTPVSTRTQRASLFESGWPDHRFRGRSAALMAAFSTGALEPTQKTPSLLSNSDHRPRLAAVNGYADNPPEPGRPRSPTSAPLDPVSRFSAAGALTSGPWILGQARPEACSAESAHLPPLPVRSLRLQSNGMNSVVNSFFARRSRSAVTSFGVRNAMAARSIGLRSRKIAGALSA